MKSFNFYCIVLAIILSFTVSSNSEPLGTTGKISGRVTDTKTGTPIVGAIIKVNGTNLGAESDASGDYVILNVNVGTYAVRCTYLGYESLVQTDVRVSADVTTRLDFAMSEKTTVTDTVEIIAKRNTLSPDQSGKIISEETIVNTGIRGIENIAAKTAGVVQDERGTSINIRGGRTNETSIIIDGVLTTNPLDGNSTAYVSNNLLQEMAVLTGGFSAEYGNVLSGVINVTTKSGSNKYSGSAEIVSDNFYKNILNTQNQGYNIYNVSLGGPLIPTKKLGSFINFYGGVERNFFLVSNASWVARELPYQDAIIPGYGTKRWSGNGKINIDFSALNKKLLVKFVGGANISRTNGRLFIQAYSLHDARKNPVVKDDNNQFYGKITHQINGKIPLFYEVQFNYFDTKHKQFDPDHGDNLFWYGDPAHNPGITNPNTRVGYDPYGLFALDGRINNYWGKTQTQYYEGSFNVVAQLKHNEIKLGGNYRYHTVRNYDINPLYLALFLYDPLKDSLNTPYFRQYVVNQVGTNFWGYTFLGDAEDNSKLSDGFTDGAKHPIIGAVYLQDKVEFKDFTINAGLRFDYLDANSWRFKDINHVTAAGGDPNKFGIEDIELKSEPTSTVSPRIGFSFPVTEKTIFHAQYGRFIQLPQLELLYNGFDNTKYWINTGGFAGTFGNPNLKPEKTTSYEIGFRQSLGDKLSFDLTAFYKETEDLIGIKKYPQFPSAIQVYANQDYGVIRGSDLSVELRRTNGLAMSIAYSLSYASGTGSTPDASFTATWLGGPQPKLTFPLSYDQRHTGTLNIDYRFTSDVTPKKGIWNAILNKLGINLLYSFNSGRPYSKKDPAINPLVSTGSGSPLQSSINGAYGPWNHRLDLKIDKTVTVWKLDFNFYAWILNVLDTRLVNSVWAGSGDPGDPGFLATQQGIDYATGFDTDPYSNTNSAEFKTLYNYATRLIGNYGPPRQLRFGIRMNY